MAADAGVERQIDAVRQALAQDSDVAPFVERLRIEPGTPWRLAGEVESIAARRKAVRVARRTLPGVDFEDAVRLDPEIRRSDAGLHAALTAALRSEPAFADVPVVELGDRPPRLDAPWIAVMVHDGVVYLGGRLDLAGKSLAEGLAWETGACCDVRNLISHEPPAGAPDAQLAAALGTLIREHAGCGSLPVEVSVAQGEVTLEGRVDEPRQRDTLIGLCWLLPEVQEVHDRLEVAGA